MVKLGQSLANASTGLKRCAGHRTTASRLGRGYGPPALRPMDHSRDQECKVQVIGSVCSQDATADCVDICGSENEQECKTSPRHGPLPQLATGCQSGNRWQGLLNKSEGGHLVVNSPTKVQTALWPPWHNKNARWLTIA